MAKKNITDILTVAACALFGALGAAQASGDHKHDHSEMDAKHGGVIFGIGDYDAELVVQHDEVELYLMDHDGNDVRGAVTGGEIVGISEGKSYKARLETRDGYLDGELDGEPSGKLKVVVRLKTVSGKTIVGKVDVRADTHN